MTVRILDGSVFGGLLSWPAPFDKASMNLHRQGKSRVLNISLHHTNLNKTCFKFKLAKMFAGIKLYEILSPSRKSDCANLLYCFWTMMIVCCFCFLGSDNCLGSYTWDNTVVGILQWGSEYRASLIFEWSILERTGHLITRLLKNRTHLYNQYGSTKLDHLYKKLKMVYLSRTWPVFCCRDTYVQFLNGH
jgi:hypothetical protein